MVLGLNLRHMGREGGVFNLYHTHSHAFPYIFKIVLSSKLDLTQSNRAVWYHIVVIHHGPGRVWMR